MAGSDEFGARLVWMLTGDKAGDNAQMRVLAQAAGLTPTEIPLEFNRLHRISNLRLGPTTRTLTEAAKQRLQPPWPDVVIASGRRSTPVARWIKRQSGGHTKLIHLGRPWGRLAWFDLVIAMPQYGLPTRPNVFQARMPFNAPSEEVLRDAADRWRERLAIYPRPWIALLAGGRSKPLVLDEAAATAVGDKVAQRARELGGSVLALTSRRTAPEAAEALAAAIGQPALFHRWQPNDSDSPYFAVLALADEFVVTGDSASMLAEAARSGRPLSIAPLPAHPGRGRRRAAFFARLLPRPLFALLVDLGLFTATRDLGRLHRTLIADGRAVMLGDQPGSAPPLADDLPAAVTRVREVLQTRD